MQFGSPGEGDDNDTDTQDNELEEEVVKVIRRLIASGPDKGGWAWNPSHSSTIVLVFYYRISTQNQRFSYLT
jgi:hypothetical protein